MYNRMKPPYYSLIIGLLFSYLFRIRIRVRIRIRIRIRIRNRIRNVYFGSGSDPDPAKSFGSLRIRIRFRIRNTDYNNEIWFIVRERYFIIFWRKVDWKTQQSCLHFFFDQDS